MPLAQPNSLPGDYTTATLPNAADYPRMFAWATDRAGGAGYVISDGTSWNLPVGVATAKLVFVGNVTVTETLVVGLSLGMKRMTLALAGVLATDKLLAVPNGTPTTGCEVVNAYPVSAGNVGIAYFTPVLGIGVTYTIPVSVYRVA